ncbi:hypothetical protein Droror1_Dr00022286 [Drosera rotundifolia]
MDLFQKCFIGAGDARPAAVRPVAAGWLAAGPGAAGLDVTGQVGAGQDAAEQVEGVQYAAGQRAAEPHRFHFDNLSFATANFSKYNGRGLMKTSWGRTGCCRTG